MHLPNLFERTSAGLSRSAASFHSSAGEDDESNTATAPIRDTEELGDLAGRADDGWRRAQGQKRTSSILNTGLASSSRTPRTSKGIKAAAMGWSKASETTGSDAEMAQKADEGWRRTRNMSAKGPVTGSGSSKERSHRSNGQNLKAAAFGIKTLDSGKNSSKDSIEEEVDKRIEEGWRRTQALKSGPIEGNSRGGAKTRSGGGRSRVKAAVVGLASKGESLGSSDGLSSSEFLASRIEEGMNRAKQVKDTQPASLNTQAHKHGKARTSILAAAVGVTPSPEDLHNALGSESSLSSMDELERKAQEGLRRAQQIKESNSAPAVSETHRHKAARPKIMAAAMGMTKLEDSHGSGSSESFTTEVERKAEEGLRRAQKVKDSNPGVQGSESHRHKAARPKIMAAAIGMTKLEDSFGEGSAVSLVADVERKAEEGFRRAMNVKSESGVTTESHRHHKSARPQIMAAAMGMTKIEDSTSSLGESNNSIAEEIQRKAEEGLKRVQQVRDSAPPSTFNTEGHRHKSARPQIMAAAMGLPVSSKEEDAPSNATSRRPNGASPPSGSGQMDGRASLGSPPDSTLVQNPTAQAPSETFEVLELPFSGSDDKQSSAIPMKKGTSSKGGAAAPTPVNHPVPDVTKVKSVVKETIIKPSSSSTPSRSPSGTASSGAGTTAAAPNKRPNKGLLSSNTGPGSKSTTKLIFEEAALEGTMAVKSANLNTRSAASPSNGGPASNGGTKSSGTSAVFKSKGRSS